MHRLIDRAFGQGGFPRRRFAIPILGLLALGLALPATASAAQALTVQKAGTGTGTVTSSPAGISCGETCSASFTEGASVTLTGAPGANSAAVQWMGCASVDAENRCLVTMSAAKSVTASFDLVQRQLSVAKSGTGTGTVTSSPAGIECGSTCTAKFTHGTSVVLTGASGANTEAVKWSGCDSVNAENRCLVSMTFARSVAALFKPLQHSLAVEKKGKGTGTVTSSPAGISCGTTCSANFSFDATVTLTGAPGANSAAVKWAGCDSVNAENKCLVATSTAKTVTATFGLVGRPLTVSKAGAGTGTVTSSPAGIECGQTCSSEFESGTLVTLMGSPGPNADPLVQWSGCESVTAEGKCLVTMSAAKAVTATFNLGKHVLSVLKLGSGTGTVTSSPSGIACGESCSAAFTHATAVTLKGEAGFHSLAVKWSGCDSVTAENKCLVAITAARSVTASFELEPQYIQYTVSVAKIGTGQGTVTSVPGGIQCGADCSETYVFRTRLTLIATPAEGSVFDHWSGGGCSGTGPCEATINSSRLTHATFVAVGKRTLSVSKAGTGQGSVLSRPAAIDCGPTCSAELDAAAKVTLTATPAAGSTFTGWTGEGCSGTSSCKVAMSEARQVTATFAQNPSPGRARCLVPRLAGKTLAKARRALAAAHCSLGKVRKPQGAKLARLRVRSSSPAAGASLAAGAKVGLRLAEPQRNKRLKS